MWSKLARVGRRLQLLAWADRQIVVAKHSLERHTEQTKPMSTMCLWQKQAARKSILSCVGTERTVRMAGGGRNDIYTEGQRKQMICDGTYNQILKDSVSTLKIKIGASSQMRCLLQERGVGAVDFANVDDHFLNRRLSTRS